MCLLKLFGYNKLLKECKDLFASKSIEEDVKELKSEFINAYNELKEI